MQGRGGLARRIARWTIVVFLIFGLIVFAVEWTFKQQVSQITGQINYHLDQQNRLQKMGEDYRSTVSNFRAYLAYGRQDFLTAARTDRDSFRSELEDYRTQLSHTTSMAQQLDELVQHSEEYFSYFPAIQQMKQEDSQTEIESMSQTTTALVGIVNEEMEQLITSERDQVNLLMQQSQQLNSLVLFIPLVFIVLGLGAALLLIRYLRELIVKPVVEMESAVRRISQGEDVRMDHRINDDEIGELMDGINHMNDQLRERHQELERNLRQLAEQHDELEAQNEEILVQQHEQEVILAKLTDRERQLQLINSYQEKLTGFTTMNEFLENSLRALLQATHHDALMLVIQSEQEDSTFHAIHAIGWPGDMEQTAGTALFGPALQVVEEKKPIVRSRVLSGEERGIHRGYERADDHYYPLYDDQLQVIGFLLLTSYGSAAVQIHDKMLTEGLINQFGMAYQAQLAGEERLKQSIRLEELNAELEVEKLMIRQQRDAIQEIIDSLHEGLVLCDREGTVSFSNKQVSQVLPDLKTGASITSLGDYLDTHSVNTENLSEQIQQAILSPAEDWKTQFSLQGRDGSIYYLELYINTITGVDMKEYYLLVFRDRTEEEQADQMKNEFVSIVSHELRTPLASILGFVEILLHREVKPEKSRKYMETIHREANRLSNLISDFLDLQRMESGKQSYTRVPFDLRTVVHDVARQWDGKQEHQVRIELPAASCFVEGDTDRITQVMHNLISNAVKYSPGQPLIDVRISDGGADWIAEVQDYGLGIPDEARDKMFGKFYRVDNSDRRQIGGTGLGLAIVREIVRDLGGEVSFDSRLGEGSTFYVRLPKYHIPQLGNKVVIIEDDDNLSGLIRATFEEQHYDILSLHTAEAAMLSLEQSEQAPLLCIVDIQLSGSRNGWEFISMLKSREASRHVPVIISSALDQPGDFAEKPNEKYLQKPFTVERMKELGMALIQSGNHTTDVVIAGHNEQVIQSALKKNGLHAVQMQVNEDFISVDLLGEDD
ncbi:ATP-binding response regulator [Paenibacillus wulumuqiensis]|uniref:ATP-binding response regulator n=1 Tax=Paenibacillus wulumuqiensis TaxID=1567107 RepID=UPI0006960C8E|nr:ATP-binding protein [Paenibacillus wulumuqiensis]